MGFFFGRRSATVAEHGRITASIGMNTTMNNIELQLKLELREPNRTVRAREIRENLYRVNWFEPDGFCSKIVKSKLLRVKMLDGKLSISDETR